MPGRCGIVRAVSTLDAVTAVAILAGLAGIVVPVLPGLPIVWAAIAVWAIAGEDPARWAVLAVASVAAGVALVAQFLVPGRRMLEAGLPGRSLTIGGLAGIVGFFVVPVIGLPLFFVAGVYAVERARLGGHAGARGATVVAIRGVGLSILIELAGGLLAAGAWLAAIAA